MRAEDWSSKLLNFSAVGCCKGTIGHQRDATRGHTAPRRRLDLTLGPRLPKVAQCEAQLRHGTVQVSHLAEGCLPAPRGMAMRRPRRSSDANRPRSGAPGETPDLQAPVGIDACGAYRLAFARSRREAGKRRSQDPSPGSSIPRLTCSARGDSRLPPPPGAQSRRRTHDHPSLQTVHSV
jgi:hypothetical protein